MYRNSPRGVNIPGEDDNWDFGSAAGFYVDATEPKWEDHYRMYSYVTKVRRSFPVAACVCMFIVLGSIGAACVDRSQLPCA